MASKDSNLNFVTGRHSFLFVIFVITGSVLLYLAKKSNLPPLTIVASSIGMMAAYAMFILAIPATKLRLDIAADNMYYLGFLYTLSSLAAAITVESAEKILANFGVAIASTIIGIMSRVALNQFRVDPYDVESASRVELSQATKRVSKELDKTIKELIKFRTMSMQVMAEGYEDVQKNVEGAGKEMFTELKRTSDKNSALLIEMAQQSNSAQENLSDTIQSLKDSNEGIVLANKAMLTQISKTSEALQAVAQKYSNTNTIEDKIIDEVKTSMNELQSKVLDENQKSSKAIDDVLGKHSVKTDKVLDDLSKKTLRLEKEERSKKKKFRLFPRLLRNR